MLLATGTVQSSSSALYQNGTIAHAECLDFSTADPQLNVSLGVDYMYYRAGARKHLMQVWIMSTHSQVSNFISNHSTMKKWHCQNQMERQTSILDRKSLLANLEGRKPPIQKASISVK